MEELARAGSGAGAGAGAAGEGKEVGWSGDEGLGCRYAVGRQERRGCGEEVAAQFCEAAEVRFASLRQAGAS